MTARFVARAERHRLRAEKAEAELLEALKKKEAP